MKESKLIFDFSTRILVIGNHMKRNGEDGLDVRVVGKILRSLDKKYNHIGVVIKESKDLDDMMIDELLGLLQVHEERFGRKKKEPVEEVVQM